MRLAYLVNQYPSVSHTFIRREILGLEARGHSVLRVSIRRSGHIVDPADQAEDAQTHYVLGGSKPRLLFTALRVLLTRPLRGRDAWWAMLRMQRQSERGFVRHLAYFIEAASLVPLMQRDHIEHVHVHFGTNAAAVALLLRRLCGIPYSMTIHGPDEFDAPIGLSLGDKMREAAFTVAITYYCAAQLRRWAPVEDWPKIQIVRCTVGPEWLAETPPPLQDTQTFVCVGRLGAQKGQAILLDAFAQVLQQHPEARLVLVGDGELRGMLEARMADLGIQHSVTITGWQTEAQVRDHLRNARALVMASFAEGLPVVLMEALALGRPVIAPAIMGIPELVRDGENGWLTITGDAESLVHAMESALSLPLDDLAAFGRRGRDSVARQHNVDTQVPILERLLLMQSRRT
jgi:glycosyltransferase involved in cell wall biosynthesis